LAAHAFALDRNAFTFTKYNLTASVDPDQQRLGVRGVITLRNDSSALQKNVALQISSTLSWKSIQFEGKPVEFLTHTYTSDIDHTGELSEAIVTLPRAVSPKQAIELAIGYEGTIPLDATRLTRIGVPAETARHTDWDQISPSFTAVRGIGYVVWYPVATEAASLSQGNALFETTGNWQAKEANANFELQMSAPGDDNGQPLEILMNRNSAECKFSKANAPERQGTLSCSLQLTDLAPPAFIIAPYRVMDSPASIIRYFANHKSGADIEVQAFTKTLPFVSGWFGQPHQKARVMELPDPKASSYESGDSLLTSFDGLDAKLTESISVHQLTHASFASPRPWIYEGLAHFMQAAYVERENGRQAAIDLLGSHLAAIVSEENTISEKHDRGTETSEALTHTPIEEFYRSKAAYVWWMLRDMVGEGPLKKSLNAYHPKQDADDAYLQKLIEAQTHRDLQWFFDDWVYHDRGLPDFRVTSVFSSQLSSGGYLVTVTVQNLGNAGAEVPISLQITGGNAMHRLKVPANAKASIRFEVPAKPQRVTVNDGSVPESDMSNNSYMIESGK
jgi:hypothetical protein